MPSLNDPLELYAQIGKVAANWAAFEILVDSAIWRFAKVSDELGACITSQLIGPSRRLDALIAIVSHRGASESTRKRLGKFAQKAVGLGEQRNRVVHDAWSTNMLLQTTARLQITAKRTLHFGYVPVAREERIKLIDEIATLLDELDELVNLLKIELES